MKREISLNTSTAKIDKNIIIFQGFIQCISEVWKIPLDDVFGFCLKMRESGKLILIAVFEDDPVSYSGDSIYNGGASISEWGSFASLTGDK